MRALGERVETGSEENVLVDTFARAIEDYFLD
jgi:hypothetical protein